MNDRAITGVLVVAGVLSLADLVGVTLYRRMRSEMPSAPNWTPESAFQSSTRYFDQARSAVSDKVPA
jgi:hypothetical protein